MDLDFMKSTSTILCLLLMVKGGIAKLVITPAPSPAPIAENSAADTPVADLTSTGGTGAVTYTLTSNEFKIASAQIQVKSGATLNFEGTSTYTLTISAEDTSSPVKSASVTLTVSLTDVNEAPMFAMSSYLVYVPPGSGAGYAIGTYTATDVDAGENGNIAGYTIASGNTGSAFTNTNGAISIATGKTLTTTTPYYSMVFEANDGGSPSLTGSTTITVLVGYEMQSGVPGLRAGVLTLVAMAVAIVMTWNKQM